LYCVDAVSEAIIDKIVKRLPMQS